MRTVLLLALCVAATAGAVAQQVIFDRPPPPRRDYRYEWRERYARPRPKPQPKVAQVQRKQAEPLGMPADGRKDWIDAVNRCLDEGKYLYRQTGWIGTSGFACEEPAPIVHRYCRSISGEFYLDIRNNVYCGVGPGTPSRVRPLADPTPDEARPLGDPVPDELQLKEQSRTR